MIGGLDQPLVEKEISGLVMRLLSKLMLWVEHGLDRVRASLVLGIRSLVEMVCANTVSHQTNPTVLTLLPVFRPILNLAPYLEVGGPTMLISMSRK